MALKRFNGDGFLAYGTGGEAPFHHDPFRGLFDIGANIHPSSAIQLLFFSQCTQSVGFLIGQDHAEYPCIL